MSAILGIFADEHRLPDDATVRRIMAGMARRGSDSCAVWRDERVVIAVARHTWELAPEFSDNVLVRQEGDLVIAADASLYYRDDLRRRLLAAGMAPRGTTASDLLLCAYRAWGAECAARLEGDAAFIIWDRRERRVVCARDFGGKRPLFHGEHGSTLIVASTIGALVQAGCSDALNVVSVAQTAAGLTVSPTATCYNAISTLAAGWTLVRERGRTSMHPHYRPPVVEPQDGRRLDVAAEELRELLGRATAERLAHDSGVTSIWLSGGWDSPAVFAAGERVLRHGGAGDHLRPVSISYPEGDPGREDELISAIAGHWGARVNWLDIGGIELVDQARERAARRDQPFAHAFEMWNRALARGSRATGARVALDGNGGDQLFQVSDVYLADLFRGGRWLSLHREWRAKRGRGFRTFFRWAVQPALPPVMLRGAGALRNGRHLRHYLERRVPSWVSPRFAAQHGLEQHERQYVSRRGTGAAAAETEWFLSNPYFPMVFGQVAEFALEEGVESRSPLYDQRVIEFAACRPRSDRADGIETKRLLRAAMRGMLPDHVLAPRRYRTGTTGAYFDRELRRHLPALLAETFQSPLLAELGIVEPRALTDAWTQYERHRDGTEGVRLFLAVQTELWLRAHVRPMEAGSDGPCERASAAVA